MSRARQHQQQSMRSRTTCHDDDDFTTLHTHTRAYADTDDDNRAVARDIKPTHSSLLLLIHYEPCRGSAHEHACICVSCVLDLCVCVFAR